VKWLGSPRRSHHHVLGCCTQEQAHIALTQPVNSHFPPPSRYSWPSQCFLPRPWQQNLRYLVPFISNLSRNRGRSFVCTAPNPRTSGVFPTPWVCGAIWFTGTPWQSRVIVTLWRPFWFTFILTAPNPRTSGVLPTPWVCGAIWFTRTPWQSRVIVTLCWIFLINILRGRRRGSRRREWRG